MLYSEISGCCIVGYIYIYIYIWDIYIHVYILWLSWLEPNLQLNMMNAVQLVVYAFQTTSISSANPSVYYYQ